MMALRVVQKRVGAVGTAPYLPLLEAKRKRRNASAMAVPTSSVAERPDYDISVCPSVIKLRISRY